MEFLNTLYIQTQGSYIHIHNKNLRVEQNNQTVIQFPIYNLDGIVVFGNVLISPFVISNLIDNGKFIAWFSQSGRFIARTQGMTSGNVLLRKSQYDAYNNEDQKIRLAKKFVIGKIKNSRSVILRGLREYKDTNNSSVNSFLKESVKSLDLLIKEIQHDAFDIDIVRGLEGKAATIYFSTFNYLIRNNDKFRWQGRSRRPPRDPLNSLLSFMYSLLINECVSACEGVGLDPQIGFLHELRPGDRL
ncbi:CRISPR-associated endonuclease Cas1 [Brockia lithotrophica]|uniref:CRISPR-associated endonuclease Cas1 n=1 Tax=Brockia lithotrophica TaxID=933949 RepID=A0A660LAN7_9BACL|nr:CRISPR-associated endonuclease Cas1 [Brockia lithotrophica]RKQ89033.1 CRISPR-associated endonuclease Cas1 [Brockia lithotrophica]